MSKLYSLDYQTYEIGTKNFIEINRDNLHSNDLDDLSVKMINANTIPLLVPLEIEEINLNVSLHYNITGMQTLANYLNNRKITASEFYELLHSLLVRLEDSKEFMLSDDKFVINSEYIYVKNNLQDIRLMYIPLKEIQQKFAFQDEFRDLMVNIIGNVTNLSGNGFQEILNYLKDSNFKIEMLRNLLNKHMNIDTPVSDITPSPSNYSGKEMVQEQAVVEEKQAKQHKTKSKKEKAVSKQKSTVPNSPKAVPTAKADDEVAITKDNDSGITPGKVKLYSALLGVILFALIWKMYLGSPSEGLLYICVGLSLLVMNLVFIVNFIIKPGSGNKAKGIPAKGKEKKKEKPAKKGKLMKIGKKSKNMDALPNEVMSSNPELLQPSNQKQYNSPEEYYNSLQNQTQLLSKPSVAEQEAAVTVLLSDVHRVEVKYPCLEMNQNGVIEKITLKKDKFIIGRNPDTCDYTLQATGVSRSHFEIVLNGGEYGIRDLNSSNGTKLNDQKLVPQRIYQLKDSDIISVAKLQIKFCKDF